MEAGSSQWCLVTEQDEVGTDWNTGGSLLNIRRHFLTVRVTGCWCRLPRVVESLSLEVFKSCLDAVWTKWLEVSLLVQVDSAR